MRCCWHSIIWLFGLFSKVKICNGFSQISPTPLVDDRKSASPFLLAHSDFICRRVLLLSLLWTGPSVATAVVPLSRDVDVGGGFDLLGKPILAMKDVVYPISMEGMWSCSRVITQVEGDQFQAESAWRAFGGDSLRVNQLENYNTKFIPSQLLGEMVGVVTDRGYELASRAQNSKVGWSVDNPDDLQFNNYHLTVVKRTVETPSDQGFGFNELYRIDDGLVTRAVQIKRRYRRAFDGDGNRVVEGLEIMKTFRVLDGVAGTEMPTSTTKSQLRLTRP